MPKLPKSKLLQSHVDLVIAHMNGRKLSSARGGKFLASIAALRAAEARDGWDGAEKRKSNVGFYQGLIKRPIVTGVSNRDLEFNAKMCLEYGWPYPGPLPKVSVERGTLNNPKMVEVAPELISAWIELCNVTARLSSYLDELRPKPVITAIGLSPKVTKTLQECGLDIDLPTIKMAEILTIRKPKMHEGKPMLDWEGKPVMEIVGYRINWSKGIKHGLSRFASRDCEACGKHIPSGRFVPVEAKCRKQGLVSLLVGTDCAENIFGIKDKGIEHKR